MLLKIYTQSSLGSYINYINLIFYDNQRDICIIIISFIDYKIVLMRTGHKYILVHSKKFVTKAFKNYIKRHRS